MWTPAVMAQPRSLHSVSSTPRAGPACPGALPTLTLLWLTLHRSVVIASAPGHRKGRRKDLGKQVGCVAMAQCPQEKARSLINLQLKMPTLNLKATDPGQRAGAPVQHRSPFLPAVGICHGETGGSVMTGRGVVTCLEPDLKSSPRPGCVHFSLCHRSSPKR